MIKRLVAAGMLVTTFVGCATVGLAGGVDIAPLGANYTEDRIDFTVKSVTGENLGVGGTLKKFSAGGTGGQECCAVIPKPGGTIKIDWKIGDSSDIQSKDVVVLGKVAENSREHSYLVVRFFPEHEVEVEVIGGSLGPKNLRMDRLFLGIKQIRHKGE